MLCPPLLGEQFAAFDLQRSIADALAARGILAVRFDYEGNGDSAGPTGGSGRLDAWLDGVDQAVALAREHVRVPTSLTLLGVRSGALVAAVATERRRDVDALVLWDPWSSGKAFLRHQRALHALRGEGRPVSGHVEVPGFVLDTATADAIHALRLPPSLRVAKALLVSRPGRPRPAVDIAERHGGQSARAVVEVIESAPGEQEACFDVEGLHRRLPSATAGSVVEWLDGAVASLEPAGAYRTTVPGIAGADARHAQWVPATEGVAIPPPTTGAVTVHERAVRLGEHGLFGIETVRCSPLPEGAPTVLFLSSGTESHVGPSRIWVDLARRFAAVGVRCIRVDLSGLGESEPRRGRPARVIRAVEAFDDVAEIVDAVGGPAQTLLVGLCSGAYQALESALELRPLAVLGVNPVLRFTPPELIAGGSLAPRRRLCEPRRPWVTPARKWVPRPLVKKVVSARRAWRARRAPRDQVGWLEELAGAGVRVYLVCGGEEARAIPDVHSMGARGAPVDARVDVVQGLDHGLTVAGQREDVMGRLEAEVRSLAARLLDGGS